jgi:hypothetical protein
MKAGRFAVNSCRKEVSAFSQGARYLGTLGKAQTPHCVPPGLQRGVVEDVEADSIEGINDSVQMASHGITL